MKLKEKLKIAQRNGQVTFLPKGVKLYLDNEPIGLCEPANGLKVSLLNRLILMVKNLFKNKRG